MLRRVQFPKQPMVIIVYDCIWYQEYCVHTLRQNLFYHHTVSRRRRLTLSGSVTAAKSRPPPRARLPVETPPPPRDTHSLSKTISQFRAPERTRVPAFARAAGMTCRVRSSRMTHSTPRPRASGPARAPGTGRPPPPPPRGSRGTRPMPPGSCDDVRRTARPGPRSTAPRGNIT